MPKLFKYQLQLTKEQNLLPNKHFGYSCFFWNWILNKKIKAYQTNKINSSCCDLRRRLFTMEKWKEFEWLKKVNLLFIQLKLENLDEAYCVWHQFQTAKSLFWR